MMIDIMELYILILVKMTSTLIKVSYIKAKTSEPTILIKFSVDLIGMCCAVETFALMKLILTFSGLRKGENYLCDFVMAKR